MRVCVAAKACATCPQNALAKMAPAARSRGRARQQTTRKHPDARGTRARKRVLSRIRLDYLITLALTNTHTHTKAIHIYLTEFSLLCLIFRLSDDESLLYYETSYSIIISIYSFLRDVALISSVRRAITFAGEMK